MNPIITGNSSISAGSSQGPENWTMVDKSALLYADLSKTFTILASAADAHYATTVADILNQLRTNERRDAKAPQLVTALNRVTIRVTTDLPAEYKNASAVYDDGTNTVMVNPEAFKRLDQVDKTALIVHELFHALDDQKNPDRMSGDTEDEVEAQVAEYTAHYGIANHLAHSIDPIANDPLHALDPLIMNVPSEFMSMNTGVPAEADVSLTFRGNTRIDQVQRWISNTYLSFQDWYISENPDGKMLLAGPDKQYDKYSNPEIQLTYSDTALLLAGNSATDYNQKRNQIGRDIFDQFILFMQKKKLL